ncbi:hypothetical protein L6164_007056 [Bauhinia variegata]|uniref:Uncharacterized protein n=1 Tax=Bauhinia variegata TaxID=167791 RepID=A0ACB9PVS6_BAUVA|nr:hypothetical protein L6164_007056 [Bauhinia variegata]
MEVTKAHNHTPREPSSLKLEAQAPATPSPLRKIIAVASIAAGINFGWAIQLSLLTPYVQLLGIPHKRASLIWLCGPISGMIVQPIVGHHSDRCKSSFGRRRPFIVAGAVSVVVAVFLIGYSADLGHMFGDSLQKKARPRSIAIFVLGFWIFDVANNMLQGPCRAFLADLSGSDHRKMRTANAFFAFFMAVGNVLGYAAGSYNGLHNVFRFTKTRACDVYCANLKSCFFISVTLLSVLATLALIYVKENTQQVPGNAGDDDADLQVEKSGGIQCFGQLFGAFRELKRPMWILLLVTCLNWIAWFPFILMDTDWMGREVYGGKVGEEIYATGVRVGTLGLMLNSVVLGVVSLSVEVLARGVGGVKRLWGIVNFLLAVCMAMTVLISKLADHSRRYAAVHGGHADALPPSEGIKAGALTLFAVLGIPLAITYSIPFALASIFSSTSGAGQGLSLGVLNLAVVVPQFVASLATSPFDGLFGGGNLPAFVVASLAALASGILSVTLLPSPPPDMAKAAAVAGGFH